MPLLALCLSIHHSITDEFIKMLKHSLLTFVLFN